MASFERSAALGALSDVKIDITVVLGSSLLPMHQLLRMGRGAVIELNSTTQDDVIVMANGRPIAHAEVVVQDDRIAVAITDPIDADDLV